MKKTTKRATKIDWIEAFNYYCSDMTITYRDVAMKFDVSLRTIEKHSAEQATPWPEMRLKVVEKLEKKLAKQRYRDAGARNDAHLSIVRTKLTLAGNALGKIANTIAKKQQEAGKDAVGDPYEALDWGKIQKISEVAHNAMMDERVILGLPTLIARSEVAFDEDEAPTPAEAQKTAEAMVERAKRLKELRNKG